MVRNFKFGTAPATAKMRIKSSNILLGVKISEFLSSLDWLGKLIACYSSIKWTKGGKCMDLPNGSLHDGNQVQLWDCSSSNANQNWNTGYM